MLSEILRYLVERGLSCPLIHAHAVFSPTPGIPGTQSDEQPVRAFTFPQHDGGRPYFAWKSSIVSSSFFWGFQIFTVFKRHCRRSESAETMTAVSAKCFFKHNAAIRSSASYPFRIK